MDRISRVRPGAFLALLLCYFRMMPKLVEQPDILPAARDLLVAAVWRPTHHGYYLLQPSHLAAKPPASHDSQLLSGYRSRLRLWLCESDPRRIRARKHNNQQFVPAGKHCLMMILVTLALRVVASIPISLPANWIIRITQVRSAADYQKAVRFSWCAVGVAPVLLIIAVFFVGAYPWQPGLRSFLTMLWLGILLVELCLYTFPKVPFTCSYLPGKRRFISFSGPA